MMPLFTWCVCVAPHDAPLHLVRVCVWPLMMPLFTWCVCVAPHDAPLHLVCVCVVPHDDLQTLFPSKIGPMFECDV